MRKLRILSESYVYCKKSMRQISHPSEKYSEKKRQGTRSKKVEALFLRKNKSGRAHPIRLIFELDRDIDETELCWKFHHDLTLLSEVIQ